jgi:two-component system, response regulator
MIDLHNHKILLVDDEKDDVFLAMKAFKEINLDKNVIVMKNGEEAINFLVKGEEVNGYTYKHDVKLILLDLRMPKVDGYEVLRTIKCNEATSHIPVVILATSGEDPDIQKCKLLGANSYIVKPLTADEFIKVVSELGHYWLEMDKL